MQIYSVMLRLIGGVSAQEFQVQKNDCARSKRGNRFPAPEVRPGNQVFQVRHVLVVPTEQHPSPINHGSQVTCMRPTRSC